MCNRLIAYLVGMFVLQATSTMSSEMSVPMDLQKIADCRTKETDVLRIIEQHRAMPPSDDEARFWTQIVNSKKYSDVRRRLALLQLFDRYVHPGMEVFGLANLLATRSWLTREKVSEVRLLAGKMPITLVEGETVFRIVLGFPAKDRTMVYLRVTDSPSLRSFCDAMLGREDADASLTITAIGIFCGSPEDRTIVGESKNGEKKRLWRTKNGVEGAL